MTVDFYLDSKFNRKNLKKIYCYIRGIEKGKKIIIPTDIFIKPENWDFKKQKVKSKKETNFSEINNYLELLSLKINKIFNIYLQNDLPKDNETFKNYLLEELNKKNEKTDNKNYLLDFFEEYLESKSSSLTKSTIDKYKTLFKHLYSYQSNYGRKILFNDINKDFFEKLKIYLIEEKKFNNNWIAKILKIFKTYLNWAYDKKLLVDTSFKKFTMKDEETEIYALTKEELQKLENLDLSKNSKLDKVRDVFIFQCYTGQRYEDVKNLYFTDIVENFWNLRTQKTKELIQIPIVGGALKIYNKYKEHYDKLPTITNQKMNEYLKELCKLAEIDTPTKKIYYIGSKRFEKTLPKYEFITTHVARKTFVTLSMEKGLGLEIIMKVTGHKKYDVLKRYLKYNKNFIFNAIDKVWG